MNNGRIKPYPFQEEAVRRIEAFDGRSYLALEMGLGKTLISLWALKNNPDWYPALVVCPASVKFNWEHESLSHINVRPLVLEGKKTPKRLDYLPKISIINYDILDSWMDVLSRMNIRTVIFDEAQYLKNPRAKRTKAARRLSKRSNQIIALSGTPLMNRPRELYPVLNMLWPDEYPSFWSYAQKFCAPTLKRWGWDYNGAANLDVLNRELKVNGMIRKRKVDVLKELPEKIRRIVPCELSDRKEYLEAKNNFLGWLRKKSPGKVRSASRAEKLVQLGYLLRLCASLKMDAVVDWSNRFMEETDEKLILFAHHKNIIQRLKNDINAKSVVVDGSVTGRNRQLAVDQFQRDKRTRLFIGSEAAAVGITLHAASTLGFAEMWWRPSDHDQAEARPHRIGQTKQVWINYFVTIDTIEERLCSILQAKQQVISTAIDGGPMPTDLNIHDELLKEIENETDRQRIG